MDSSSNPSVCIFPNTLEPRVHAHAASARIRGRWVARYLEKAGWDCWLASGWAPQMAADVSIFQKVYEHPQAVKLAASRRKAGKAVVLDLCDADWLVSKKRDALVRMLPHCTVAVGSSPIITAWLSQFVSAFTVGDGIDMEVHPKTKKHEDKPVLKVVWFGNLHNYELIRYKIPQILSMSRYEMVTISDHPEATKPWKLETINQDLLACDIFWDPRGHGYEWECKTNNKELKAWALGIPVAHDVMFVNCLRRFEDAEGRNKEAQYRLEVVKRFWSMDVVIRQWEAVLRAAWAMVRRK